MALVTAAAVIGAVVAWPLLRSQQANIPPPPVDKIAQVTESETALTIRPGFDGSYYLTGGLNGTPTLFRILPFAGRTILDPTDAENAGIEVSEVFRYEDALMASGPVAEAETDTLRIASKTFENVPVLVRAEGIGVSTLGRDVLDRFDDWGERDGSNGAPFVLEY